MNVAAENPVLIVVIGVSGVGKSSVARELARRCRLHFIEADEFHSREARARMAAGQPLDDTWRAPWLAAIGAHLRELSGRNRDCVLAFSGLKQRYREVLRHNGFHTVFLFLRAPRPVIRERLKQRPGHFMPASLLDDQCETLEPPRDEDDVISLDAAASLETVVEEALRLLKNHRILPAAARQHLM